MSKYLKILVISFDKKPVLLTIFCTHGLVVSDVCQPKETERVVWHDLLQDVSELIGCFLNFTNIHEHLSFQAVLVHWCFGLTLTCLVYPMNCSVGITSSSGQISKSHLCINVIWIGANDLFVESVCLIELMVVLVPVSYVEKSCQFQGI